MNTPYNDHGQILLPGLLPCGEVLFRFLIFHLPPNYKHFVRVYNESGITDRFAVLPHGERVDVSFAIRYNNGESSHESSGDQRSRGPAVHRHLSQYTNQVAYLF